MSIIAILNIHTGKRGKLFVLSSNRALIVAHQVYDHLHTFEFKSYARCSTHLNLNHMRDAALQESHQIPPEFIERLSILK